MFTLSCGNSLSKSNENYSSLESRTDDMFIEQRCFQVFSCKGGIFMAFLGRCVFLSASRIVADFTDDADFNLSL